MRDVAAQAGLVLRNVALIEDVRASRQRLVAAADEARRRLERNLHDGAQQQLVALRITLGLARQVARSSPQEADELLAQTEREAQDALEELRDLARGIYPPLLADLGLAAALEAQAQKAALPVTVEAPGLGRYSQEIEAAVYFCVLEALQNAAKYAQAQQARVTLGHDGGALTFTVGDDGRGFDRVTTPMGTGVQGMSDRLAALGGTIEVVSAPGAGTRVTGRVPAAGLSSRRRPGCAAGIIPARAQPLAGVGEAEPHLAERDPVACAHQEARANLPSVGAGAVGRAAIGQHPVAADAPQLGVAPRHGHVGECQIGAGCAADREHRPAPPGQHEARQPHGPPCRPQLPGKAVPPRRGPVGQPGAAPGRPQVVQQAGELPRILRSQREVQPVQEGVV